MPAKGGFTITDTDKEWVHESFEWLVKAYGYPRPDLKPVLFNDEFFPLTLAHKQPAIEPLIADLCALYNIDPSIISFDILQDLESLPETPFQVEGIPFECEVELFNGSNGTEYKFHFSQSLLKYPRRLVFNTVFKFIQIDLAHDDSEWLENEDQHFLFYLIGIYRGWGIVLAQTMTDTGYSNDGFWERRWRFISPMPIPVMAYALALYADMLEEKSPEWKSFLPSDLRKEFEKAIEFIEIHKNPVFNRQELTAHRLFRKALELTDSRQYDEAIETYQKALFMTADITLRSELYNNMGYVHLYKDEFEKGIVNFHKALELNPSAPYANDNMGFAYIMTGELETGRHYLSIALETERNEPSYSYRNMALYHQKRGEFEKARINFEKAFNNITFPVDWLEYFFARFLYEQGNKEEAFKYLKLAIEKGEPQAIRWMKDINPD